MYRKKIMFCILVCLLILALCINLSFAKDKIVAKFGHTATSLSAMGVLIEEFAQRVNNRTEQLVIEVYPDNQLGGDQFVMEGVQLGTVHFCNASYGLLTSFVRELGAMELPYMFGEGVVNSGETDISIFLKIAESDLFKEWEEMLIQNYGIKILAPAWYYGHRSILVKKPVYTPEDLKGLKIRVAPATLYVESMSGLGGIATPIDWPEVYMALSQGVIDGVDTTMGAFYNNRFCEIAKYCVPTEHIFGINNLVANEKFYQSIPEYDRKILDEEVVWFQEEAVKSINKQENDSIELLKSEGVTIMEIDLELFKESVEKYQVAEKLAEKEGWRSDTLERFRKLLADIKNE